MAATWIPFDVVAGETVRLTLALEPGALRSFHLHDADGNAPAAPVEIAVANALGRPLWSHAWPKYPPGRYVVCQPFARGAFTISFTAADGKKGEAKFEVSNLVDRDELIDVVLK